MQGLCRFYLIDIMNCVVVNIGSNMGDRRMNLSRAVRKIGIEFGPFEVSHVVESEPWGYDSQNKFLNMAVMFWSHLAPVEILKRLQNIEQQLCPAPHRDESGAYVDRVIDIDLIAVDNIVFDNSSEAEQKGEPKLRLPHPALAQRRFFLEPLAEIAPGWQHPVTGLTADEMLHNLDKKEEK